MNGDRPWWESTRPRPYTHVVPDGGPMPTTPSLPERAHPIGEKVAYSWECKHASPSEHVIDCLRVWHWCDHSVWRTKAAGDPTMRVDLIPEPGWLRGWISAHDFVSADPLHVEPSLYLPECCGLHGFIRDGRWVDA